MQYLLDTCVISELTKATPNADLVAWFETQEESRLCLSVISLGEIEKGICRLPKTKKRNRLERWFYDEVMPRFLGRIVEVGQRTMSMWARVNANLNAKGIVRPSFDSLLEATALERDLILVTRNVKNFQGSTITILNPWEK